MYLISKALQYGAPFFIITSPVTSYADQIISINRNRSSAGFSLDIPLIMLIASVMKVFYWFGAYYDVSLLVQAVITIGVQIVLLKVALDNRPSPGTKSGIEHTPFSNLDAGGLSRPYEFWQWKNARPYWMFLAYFAASLTFIHVLMSYSQTYIDLLGYIGLAIEATLPLPQIIANHSSRSCKGFRLSVVAAWVLGDTTKLSYFFFGGQFVPWAFRLCAMFQCVCDCYLGFQFYLYTPRVAGSPRDQESWGAEEKDIRMI
ncbi:PQ-loop repeat-containing protein [Aspergillus ruber CBS 135680]|uniref:PQ loop repeat protein n=1 Tax=Aspergillus ruber (strain CBS 135680) TaxID=1388766 RepID=A0A017SQF5_ASPRC|nr:uncharacterized protein EURHEDRAFT_471530 [Aspergillus ruber CBS 135680]EYE98495.1 hypothetical protein EURHEDRAFT_471530 [Aspergillus ruber CBS 135680]